MDIKNLLQNILDIAYDKYFNLIKVYSQTDFNVIINNLKEKAETDFELDEDTIFPGLIVNATTYEGSADTYIVNFYMLNADLSRTDVLTSIVDLVRSSQYDLSIKVIEKKDTKLTNINCYNNTHVIFVNSASMKLKIVHKSCTCTTNTKPRLVTSVNGQTGDVFLPDYKGAVTSVNGQTGDVFLPDYEGAVTSVNGQTGDVDIFIPTQTSDLVNDSDFATNEETDEKLETKQDNLIFYKEIPGDSSSATIDILGRAGRQGVNSTFKITKDEILLTYGRKYLTTSHEEGIILNNDGLQYLLDNTPGTKQTYQIFHEGNTKTLNGESLFGEGDIKFDASVDAYTKAETDKMFIDSSVYNAGKYATIDSLNNYITEQHTVDESQNTAIDGLTTDLGNLETTVTGLADDVLDISTKVKTLDSSYLDLHLTNIDDLGKQAIKDIVGAGDAYTKEETDNLFIDSSTYNSNTYVTKVNSVFNNCNDLGVYFVSSFTDTDSFKLNTGKYWKQNSIVNDPYALTFTKIDNGLRNNGSYVFTEGNIYANSDGFLTDDINDSRLVKYPELKTLSDKVDDLQLFKFPNVTIFGEPTIQNGQVSDFSNENYLQFPFLVDFHNLAFEIHMCFTTGNNVTTLENIFDSIDGLAFAVRNGHFVVAMSSNGTAWDMGEHVGSYTVLRNTTYYVKFTWNKLQYKLEYSTDKTEYNTDILVTDTRSLYAKQIIIGKSTDGSNSFSGSINLNNCYLYIMGNLVWSGMDDAGLATRLATDLSNVDEAGKEKIKEIAGNLKYYKEDDNSAFLGTQNLEEVNTKGFGYTVEDIGMAAVEHGTGTIISMNEDMYVLGYLKEGYIVSKIQLTDVDTYPIQLEVQGQYEAEGTASGIYINSSGVLIDGLDFSTSYARINNEEFKYKDNEVLTTANEWYGTQAEYDALTEYKEGVNYYIYDVNTPVTTEYLMEDMPVYSPDEFDDGVAVMETFDAPLDEDMPTIEPKIESEVQDVEENS